MRIASVVPVVAGVVSWVAVAQGCGGGHGKKEIDTQEGVRTAYENFEPTILKITSAGIAAKGTASQGANIPVIPLVGFVSGTGGVGGTVAQSSGLNENLNLWVQLESYSDTGAVYFQTDDTSDATKLQFDLQIRNQPANNTMSGTLTGSLTLSGEVDGTGLFDLATVTDLADDDGAPDPICTHVTGTVTAESDTVNVDFVLPLTLDSALRAACAAL